MFERAISSLSDVLKYERDQNEHRGTTIRESASLPKGQQKQPLTRQNFTYRWIEAITAILLGVVAIATTWSG